MSSVETTIFKNGNSQAITVQNKLMEALSLKIGDAVTVNVVDNQLIIKKKEKNFKEKWNEFFEHGGSYEDYHEENFGDNVGREVW